MDQYIYFKVIMLGNTRVYNVLSHHEENFLRIFKIKAEFDQVQSN